MTSLDKRRIALAGGGIALAGLFAFSDPIADIRVTHDAAPSTISKLEAKVDLGLVAFSFLHSWKRVLR
ncbi:hypothetical protein M9978_18435 [Sphingomonas sp. MG17]|jgi:hypothetical protein|uniref:Uncharacterized protein n=1 Tax=Sphingomonas tagetis TaxID=2949092 RepID=A0A9X2HN93_9SPHN|nr:hypothetical protein [Sphingomonas tagetis]MCP3732404.1 hypothetical protein [Sphingomonas tagetis]